MAGHAADGAFFLQRPHGQWITSSFYRDELPGLSAQLERFRRRRARIRARRGTCSTTAAVTSIRRKKTASASTPRKARSTFRTRCTRPERKDFFHDLLESPFGNEITLEAARLIIADEQLGKD